MKKTSIEIKTVFSEAEVLPFLRKYVRKRKLKISDFKKKTSCVEKITGVEVQRGKVRVYISTKKNMVEKAYKALVSTEWNKSESAKQLGVSCRSLNKLIEKHQLRKSTIILTTPQILEKEDYLEALENAYWNKAEAARSLGINIRTVFRKINIYDLKPKGEK